MPTIKDVAQAAGVSVKTASRALNGKESVRSYLRERVDQAVAALDYQPNLAARQLSKKRSFVIGMIVPRAGEGYIPRLILALSAVCRTFGFQLVTEAVEPDRQHEAFRQGGRFALMPDAIVLAPRYADDPDLLARFAEQRVPLVRIGGSEGPHGIVVHISEEAPTIAIVGHLLSIGHRRIALIAMPLVDRTTRERHAGYVTALASAALPIDPALVVFAGFTYRDGADAAGMLLSRPDRPTAIFAASDALAAGALARAQAMKLAVPHDVAIAGFDDGPIARAPFPPLTSISFPVDAIAVAVARAAIFGEPPLLTDERRLMVRSSTSGDGQLCADPYGD